MLDQLKTELSCKTDAELSEKLNVQPATLSGWRKRGSVGTLVEHLLESKVVVSFDKLFEFGGTGNHQIGINLGSGGVGDAELQKLLQAALALSTPEELKQIIREHIRKCTG